MQNGTVFQRGATWTYQYRLNGKWKTKGGFKTKEECEIALRKALVVTEEGALAPSDVSQIAYETVRDAYLFKKPKQRKYSGLQHLDDFFAGRKFVKITPAVIDEFIEHRRDEDDAADPTIRRNLVCLRAMFRMAGRKGQFGMRDIPYFDMPEDSAAAGQYLTPQEFALVLNGLDAERQDKLKEDPDAADLKPFFTFLYATACRLGAAEKITWEMVNDKCDVLNLPGSITKSGEPLEVLLAGKMLDPIAAMLRKQFRCSGSPIFDSTNYRPEWNKACARAGLRGYNEVTRKREDKKGYRIHDCRCSGAVNLLNSGVPWHIVKDIGGWKTDAMLTRYNVKNAEQTELKRLAMIQSGEYVDARMSKNA